MPNLPIILPDQLLLDLSQIHDDDLEEFALQKYRELFIDANGRGQHECHDGETVIFWETRCFHALHTPKEWRQTAEKQILDTSRLARLPWVLPLIKGDMPNSECWLIKCAGRNKH